MLEAVVFWIYKSATFSLAEINRRTTGLHWMPRGRSCFAFVLTIDVHDTDAVVAWPTNYMGFDYSGFVLESTTNLASGIWTASPV